MDDMGGGRLERGDDLDPVGEVKLLPRLPGHGRDDQDAAIDRHSIDRPGRQVPDHPTAKLTQNIVPCLPFPPCS